MNLEPRHQLICPSNLKVFYYDEISTKRRAKGIVQAVKKGRIHPFVVEKSDDDQYVLVKGFLEYSAYVMLQPNEYAPCLVYPESSERARLIRILTTSIPLEKTSWLFKNVHIMKLIDDYKMDPKEIARECGFETSKIKSYILSSRIPLHIRSLAIEMNAKTVIESICQSTTIPDEMKNILYERAILSRDKLNRLDGKKFNLMKYFCSECYFPNYLLHDNEKLEALVDELLINMFDLSDHFKQILRAYLKKHFPDTFPPK